MAERRSSNGSRKYSYRKESASAAKKPSGAKKANDAKDRSKKNASEEYAGAALFVVPILLVVLALLTTLALFWGKSLMGVVGEFISNFLRGMFGVCAFLIPVFSVVFAITFRSLVREEQFGTRVAVSTGIFISIDLLSHVLFLNNEERATGWNLVTFFDRGKELRGGGVVGSGLGMPLWNLLKLGLPIILVAALIILIPMFFGMTPVDVWNIIKEAINDRRERRAAEAYDGDDAPKGAVVREGRGVRPDGQLALSESELETPRRHGRGVIEIDSDPDGALAPDEREQASRNTLPGADNIDVYDESDADGGRRPTAHEVVLPEDVMTDDDAEEKVELAEVFAETEDEALVRSLREKYGDGAEDASGEFDLEVKRRRVKATPSEQSEKADAEPAFALPPVELLTEDPGKHDPGIEKEIADNAARLTAALDEFNVRASILNTMHGPTVTRFELGLDTGVRVRQVQNLADDISYSLAASGSIRIEAPIPGKSAVGIEVPNKIREKVYLRSLIEAPEFKKSDKPLWAALGADVAGEGVYFDVSKMPHLLISGTTNSGKSVCINTIIMSLMYRNAPDEVKMILIDPKHVEFAVYDGMPHLLVPVVTDMKKAAGALQWAVSEMERRYGMLEGAKVRDIASYTKLAASSEEPMEPMPRIVIIIDELAELMMQARDSVEPSICRIAQKARAAGMHLIIGTQRPDVSVVTGLIKANIPSRIALTVKSQVDSRTMIDKAGAEKLLGYGDMLFNPIGIPEPKRVQGAFVSDEEITAVVEYLKAQATPDETSSEEILAEIEREAIKCDNPKKGGASSLAAPGDEGGEEDPMLMDALELAVESGKISTSLIQRRLSLGYGRAAKLIDRMQQLGYVSAPDGQKPRDVLISPEQFLELKMRDE